MHKEEGNAHYLISLYNSFTFFASAYHIHNFSKCVIHLRRIKESGRQKHQLRGPTGSEATAQQPRRLRDIWRPYISAGGSGHDILLISGGLTSTSRVEINAPLHTVFPTHLNLKTQGRGWRHQGVLWLRAVFSSLRRSPPSIPL